jgi:hypothetical protein
MTKLQHAQKHITLREQWFETKFNIFIKAYAHAHMFFVRKDSIIDANKYLETAIKDYGTFKVFKEKIESL